MPKQQAEPSPGGVDRELGLLLTDALVQAQSDNDFLNRFLQVIGKTLDVSRLALYDYDDPADFFDVLYWRGYGLGGRSLLRRVLASLNIRRALQEREPFWSDESRKQLLIPLYFHDTLEAVLLLDCGKNQALELNDARLGACRLISRFLGLFMSSSRLPVNRAQNLAARTDLQRAREIQLSYLPSDHPVTDRYEIYGYNQSSALVGGDYFDYFRQRDSSIQCIVADACGHGLAAALIMSTFRGLLHSEVRPAREDLTTLFTNLNRQLYSGGEVLQYLTAVFFDYVEETRELRHFNAGHFDPLVIHADGRVSELSGGGTPLGMFPASVYEMKTSTMKTGDLLILFTDGLVELRNARDEFFGVEGIRQAIIERRNLPLKDLAREVLGRAARFSHKAQPDDDLTLFLMRFR